MDKPEIKRQDHLPVGWRRIALRNAARLASGLAEHVRSSVTRLFVATVILSTHTCID